MKKHHSKGSIAEDGKNGSNGHAPGGTLLFGLYGYVPLDRVWFFGLAVLNNV